MSLTHSHSMMFLGAIDSVPIASWILSAQQGRVAEERLDVGWCGSKWLDGRFVGLVGHGTHSGG